MNTETTNCVCECACHVANETGSMVGGIIAILVIIAWCVWLGIFIHRCL